MNYLTTAISHFESDDDKIAISGALISIAQSLSTIAAATTPAPVAEKRPSALDRLDQWRKEYQVNVFANPNGIAIEIYDRAGNVIAHGRDDQDIEAAFNRAEAIIPVVAPADWVPGLVGSTPATDSDLPF